jgi:hypothetical protein
MLAICREYPYFARGYFKVDPKQVTLEQASELATRYPVFRIETAAVDGPERGGTVVPEREAQMQK